VIHPTHEIIEDWDVPDPHSPMWRCRKCRECGCSLCDDSEELAMPCAGEPWWEQ